MSTIQLRRGTAAQWTTADPVLAVGEAGFETDTGKLKIGDGLTAWNSLAYAAVLPSDPRLSDARTPTAHSHSGADITSGTVDTARLSVGTTVGTVAAGDHNHSGVYAAASHTHGAADVTSGTLDIARIPTGTTGSTVALGNHAHAGVYDPAGTAASAVATHESDTTNVHGFADTTVITTIGDTVALIAAPGGVV